MKKIFFLLAVFLLWTPCTLATWNNDVSNPIHITYQGQTVVNPSSPSVLYENSVYKMWYHTYNNGYFSIGYAESSDGKNWEVKNPAAITPSSEREEIGAAEPMVIHTNQYQMWYNSFNSDGIYKIRYATSDDGNSWTVKTEPVLQGASGSWDSNGITNPAVIFENNTYKMWYISGSPWQIGYAISTDGISWTKPSSVSQSVPSLGFVGGPSVLKLNSIYHMWYHTGQSNNTAIFHVVSPDGINWQCSGTCQVLTNSPDSFNSVHIVAPSVIKEYSTLQMWYSGNDGNSWQIGLASEPLDTKPIVFLPGLLGSWNKDAILHNETVSINDWKLSPFVTEYNGIVQTFAKLGLEMNKDFYIFPYDWRKSIVDSANDLNTFIHDKILNNNPNSKVIIVGHSLGGLVGRIYTQNNKNNVSKLITIGTPHLGAVQSYNPIEGGMIERDNTLNWLAQKIVLQLNRHLFDSDRLTIQNKFPVAFDLFPTFSFLLKNSNLIDINSLSIKNNNLQNYNSLLPSISDIMTIIYGEKDNASTPSEYTTEDPSIIDTLLGNYIDGKPISTSYDKGDYTVLSKSAVPLANITAYKFPLDHGELIYKKESISKLLDILEIPYQQSDIIEGKKTQLNPSIIFLIQSPATLKVTYNGIDYPEEDGIILIPNASTGTYVLHVTGLDYGNYTVHVGQISANNETWDTLTGDINQNPPTNQVDTYSFYYDNLTSHSIIPTPTVTPTLSPTPTITLTPTLIPTPTPTPTSIFQGYTLSGKVLIEDQNFHPKKITSLANVRITLKRTSKSGITSYETISGKDGSYKFVNLLADKYTIEGVKYGKSFRPHKNNTKININKNTVINLSYIISPKNIFEVIHQIFTRNEEK